MDTFTSSSLEHGWSRRGRERGAEEEEEEEEEEAIDPSELPEGEEEISQTEDLADEDEKTDATHTEL